MRAPREPEKPDLEFIEQRGTLYLVANTFKGRGFLTYGNESVVIQPNKIATVIADAKHAGLTIKEPLWQNFPPSKP